MNIETENNGKCRFLIVMFASSANGNNFHPARVFLFACNFLGLQTALLLRTLTAEILRLNTEQQIKK